MTNIPQKSWKCWFHLAGIYIVTLITISALESEFIVYAKFRHEFLKQTKSHLRTVLVDGIPHKLRNPVVLRAYLDLLYPGAVKHIRLGINIKYLQRLVDEREQAVTNLERAMYAHYISHTRPKVKVGKMTHEVDAIVYYTQLLDSLNNNIKKEQLRVREVAGLLDDADGGNDRRHRPHRSVGSLDEFLRLTEIKLSHSHRSRHHRSRPSGSGSGSRSGSRRRSSSSSTDSHRASSGGDLLSGSKKMLRGISAEAEDEYSKLSYQAQTISTATETRDAEDRETRHPFQRDRPPTQTRIFAYDAFRDVEKDDDDEDIGDDGYDDYDDENNAEDSAQSSYHTWTQWCHRMWASPTLSECWTVLKYGMYADIDEEVVLHRRSSSSSASSLLASSGVQLADREGSLSDDHDDEGFDEEDGINETSNLLVSSTQHDRRLFLSRAFVTFRTFTAATTAKQVIHMQLAGRLAMTEAPEPTDITWVNMYMTRRATAFRQYLVDAVIILLIIVWVAPVTLLSYVFSYDAVTEAIPSLKRLAEEYNIVESMIDLLQPIVLVAIMNLLPPLLMALGVFEGSIALSVNQFRAYHRYFAFQIVNVFLVNAIAGSVIDAITTVYDSPPTVFTMFGNSLPKMGGFFTNYLLVKALTGLGMELIRVPALFMSLGKKLFTPNTTPRDQQNLFYGGSMRNVTNPGWFPFHKIYAQDMLLFVICLTYSCVAPLTLIAGIMYFFLASVIYKHQMIYIYEPMYETGGKWWPIMARGMVVALLFAQALLTGMFILKETYTELYFLLFLFALTLTYYFYVASIYTPLAAHLPLDIAMALDEHHGYRRDAARQEAAVGGGGRPPTTRKSSSSSRRRKSNAEGSDKAISGHATDGDEVVEDVEEEAVDEMFDADDYLQPSVRAPVVYPEVEFLDRDLASKITNASSLLA